MLRHLTCNCSAALNCAIAVSSVSPLQKAVVQSACIYSDPEPTEDEKSFVNSVKVAPISEKCQKKQVADVTLVHSPQ